MTQEQLNQTARELAERCAEQFITQGIMLSPLPGNKPTVVIETILRSLNLPKLVEDEAMVDWLQKREGIVTSGFVFKWFDEENITLRTAIRNAMKEGGE